MQPAIALMDYILHNTMVRVMDPCISIQTSRSCIVLAESADNDYFVAESSTSREDCSFLYPITWPFKREECGQKHA